MAGDAVAQRHAVNRGGDASRRRAPSKRTKGSRGAKIPFHEEHQLTTGNAPTSSRSRVKRSSSDMDPLREPVFGRGQCRRWQISKPCIPCRRGGGARWSAGSDASGPGAGRWRPSSAGSRSSARKAASFRDGWNWPCRCQSKPPRRHGLCSQWSWTCRGATGRHLLYHRGAELHRERIGDVDASSRSSPGWHRWTSRRTRSSFGERPSSVTSPLGPPARVATRVFCRREGGNVR